MSGPDRQSSASTTKVGDKLPERSYKPDNVQLMLYNAALWNAHRIHFDEPYAKEVEGYPTNWHRFTSSHLLPSRHVSCAAVLWGRGKAAML